MIPDGIFSKGVGKTKNFSGGQEMFSILAHVGQHPVGTHDLSSVFSLIGIGLFLLILISLFTTVAGEGFAKVIGIALNIFSIYIILYFSLGIGVLFYSDTDYERDHLMVMSKDGTTVAYESDLTEGGQYSRYYKGKQFPYKEDLYKNHFFWDYHYKGSSNYISPWVWHPAAFFWVPVFCIFMSLVVFVGVVLFR